MKRLCCAVVMGCAWVGCGQSATDTGMQAQGGAPANTAGIAGNAAAMGGSNTGGGGSSSGGANSGAGAGGSAGMPAGAGGSAGAMGGAGGTMNNGGMAGAGAGTAGMGGMDAGDCPASAIICDDFESYTDGATDLSPDWIAYSYFGTVTVDTTKPRGGAQSLHLTTEAGMRRYASLIRYTSGVEVVPLRHFGRMMVWLTYMPEDAHWNLNMSSGPVIGFPDEEAKLLEGGMFGKLMSNFAQRLRPMDGADYALRGGGPQEGDAPADSDCAVAAPNQTIAAGTWVCWEWEFDATAAATTARVWVDEVAMDEIDAIGFGTQCQGPGFNDVPMAPDYPWESPELFDKIFVGWEQYQDTPAQELWVDDIVIGTERVGCPMP